MIDHITLRAKDIEKTKQFYSKALKPIGYECTFDKNFGDSRVVGFSKNGKTDTWFVSDAPHSTNTHIAWTAANRKEVDLFYQESIAAGGTDNGKPGIREIYHPDYYGAFVIDPDGNNIEVCCHEKES